MLQIKPHQCEDLNHLTGKAKPRQTLVRNRACLGEMSPRQRQHSLGCYLWFCPSHNHPEFQCFSSNPCCSTLGPSVKVSLFAVLLLTTSISELSCLQKQASNHESSTLRENKLFFLLFPYPYHRDLFKEGLRGLTQGFWVLLCLGRAIPKPFLHHGLSRKPCDKCSGWRP